MTFQKLIFGLSLLSKYDGAEIGASDGVILVAIKNQKVVSVKDAKELKKIGWVYYDKDFSWGADVNIA